MPSAGLDATRGSGLSRLRLLLASRLPQVSVGPVSPLAVSRFLRCGDQREKSSGLALTGAEPHNQQSVPFPLRPPASPGGRFPAGGAGPQASAVFICLSDRVRAGLQLGSFGKQLVSNVN